MFAFVEETIHAELDWLNAPPGPQKILSFVMLALFPVAAFAGLIVVFYFLMYRVAAKA
jgi:hypothetical protein